MYDLTLKIMVITFWMGVGATILYIPIGICHIIAAKREIDRLNAETKKHLRGGD